jgi:hypothetical protein
LSSKERKSSPEIQGLLGPENPPQLNRDYIQDKFQAIKDQEGVRAREAY